jgi:hypothetical protein
VARDGEEESAPHETPAVFHSCGPAALAVAAGCGWLRKVAVARDACDRVVLEARLRREKVLWSVRPCPARPLQGCRPPRHSGASGASATPALGPNRKLGAAMEARAFARASRRAPLGHKIFCSSQPRAGRGGGCGRGRRRPERTHGAPRRWRAARRGGHRFIRSLRQHARASGALLEARAAVTCVQASARVPKRSVGGPPASSWPPRSPRPCRYPTGVLSDVDTRAPVAGEGARAPPPLPRGWKMVLEHNPRRSERSHGKRLQRPRSQDPLQEW